jgi:hypothetical protein
MRYLSQFGSFQLKVHGQFRPDPEYKDMSGTTRILSTRVSYFQLGIFLTFGKFDEFWSKILSSYFSIYYPETTTQNEADLDLWTPPHLRIVKRTLNAVLN